MGPRRMPCGWRLLFFFHALLLAEVHHGSSSSSSGVKAAAAADALPPTRLFPAEGMCAQHLQMHCSISAIGRFPSPLRLAHRFRKRYDCDKQSMPFASQV